MLEEIRQLIDEVHRRLTVRVNAELVLLYWRVGRVIAQGLEDGEDDSGLAAELCSDYGRVWNARQLDFCVRAAQTFSEDEIRNCLASQVSWSHMRRLVAIPDLDKRRFYAEQCGLNGWSVPQLTERIDSLLFERSVSSRRPDELPDQQELERGRRSTPDLLVQDPLLIFLGVQSLSPEEHLEEAVLRELEGYLLEQPGFSLVARQRRLPLNQSLDLVMYHRRQRRLALFVMAPQEIAADRDRMDFYLHWLSENEKLAGEEGPLGVFVRPRGLDLWELADSGCRPADYPSLWPAREYLSGFLRDVYQRTRLRLGL